MSPLSIDVWSDIACPWCYIGTRNLDAALALLDNAARDVVVDFHSYLLAPDTPADTDAPEIDFLVRSKGMPAEQVRQMFAHVTQAAADAGLHYDFDIARHANTRKAHELLHYAKSVGRQSEMAERLFAAHFTEGKFVGGVTELADLAAEIGLDRDAVESALLAGTYADAVDADLAQANAYGISGVPFFVIDGRYGVSGAQPPEVLAQAIGQVLAERADT
ncbi:DsbA family oxidoreductase [Gordonia aichiensis]|nr:DsbA family oxidoreductase [Gordonia aichiensis]